MGKLFFLRKLTTCEDLSYEEDDTCEDLSDEEDEGAEPVEHVVHVGAGKRSPVRPPSRHC